jgi:hypothetical protein
VSVVSSESEKNAKDHCENAIAEHRQSRTCDRMQQLEREQPHIRELEPPVAVLLHEFVQAPAEFFESQTHVLVARDRSKGWW